MALDSLSVVLLHPCFDVLVGASNVDISGQFALCLVDYYTVSADVVIGTNNSGLSFLNVATAVQFHTCYIGQ